MSKHPSPFPSPYSYTPKSPSPIAPQPAIIDLSIPALITSLQSIMTTYMMKNDMLLKTLGHTVIALKVSQGNHVAMLAKQLTE